MTRSRSLLKFAAVVLVAFSLVMGSCFTIRKFTMKPKALAFTATKGQVFLDMYPKSIALAPDGYPFVVVGLNNLDHIGTSKWDTKENYGGKFDTVQDDDIRDAVRAGGTDNGCDWHGVGPEDLTGFTWEAWRSASQIDSGVGSFSDNMRVQVHMSRPSGQDNNSYGEYIIIAGMYLPDNDSTVEDSEVWCSSVIWSTYPFSTPVFPTIFPTFTFPIFP